jgi:exodeoxyribonuclease-3
MSKSFFKNTNLWLLLSLASLLSACHLKENGQNTSPGQLKIITHNVWYGFTKVPDRKPDWIRWMEKQQADVVCLQELNGYSPGQLMEDAKAYGHGHSALLKTEGFPTGITSRFAIEDIKRIMQGFHHGLMRAKILDLYIYVVHLHPGNHEIRNSEIDLLLRDAATLPKGAKVILAGDFNALARTDSSNYVNGDLVQFFKEMDKKYNDKNLRDSKLDYAVIDKLVDAGFEDVEATKRPINAAFTGSYPTKISKEGEHGDQRRLDYIFVNQVLRDKVVMAQTIANDTTWGLSDHLPVATEILLSGW